MAVLPAFIGLLLAVFVSGDVIEITPKTAVVKVGDSNVHILCKVDYRIDSCRMMIGSTNYIIKPNNAESNVVYSGRGFDQGECGVEIKSVREEMNGNVSCMLPPRTGNIEMTASMRLRVAKSPNEPVLLVPPQPRFNEGELYNAQCSVSNGRPVARLTWFLDNNQITDSALHLAVREQDLVNDLESIRQNITLRLTPDHNGKKLTCVAEHEAYPGQSKQASVQLFVYYKPHRLDSGTNTIFGLKIGSEGKLNVTVRSNPMPEAEWAIGGGGVVIRAGQRNEEGTYEALHPLPLGDGFYNVSLVITKIAKEDVDRTFYLRLKNRLSEDDVLEIPVRLSTMDEPAGVELDTGAIVGIVIGVLVVLIAVFLLVFAKATDRWCFGGQRDREQGKGSGESTPGGAAGDVLLESGSVGQPASTPKPSDTESAGGGRVEHIRLRLSELGARVRAALPRGRDKVQATDAQNDNDDKPFSEEKKKDIVYAELQLGEQPTPESKPPAATTEYAEIVYTDQPQKEGEAAEK